MLLFVWSFSALFLPIFSQLDDEDADIEEMSRLYTLMAKWVVVLTLPIFLFVVGFPEAILSALFGEAYASGGLVLAVVVVGFFVEVTTGMTRAALTAIGDTRFIFWTTTGTLVANVVLGLLLISPFGIGGVATATAVTYAALNVASAVRLYLIREFHAISRALVRVTISTTVLFALLYVVLGSWIRSSLLTVLLAGMGFYAVHLVVFLAVGGLETEDVGLLRQYTNSIPINLQPLFNLLERG